MGNSALLPAGQVEGRNLQLLFRQAHKARSLPDPAVDFFLGKAHIGWTEGDVLIDRLFKELILGILEDQPHPEPGGSCKLLIGPDVLGRPAAPGPEVGFSRPLSCCINVDFPEPVWPMIPRNSPSLTSKLM